MVSVEGVAIYHIDATTKTHEYIEAHMEEEGLSVIAITLYDNSYTEHKLIALVEADGNNSIEKTYCVSDSDLFSAGSVVTGLTWYDGSSVGCSITIGEFTDEGVTISIDF